MCLDLAGKRLNREVASTDFLGRKQKPDYAGTPSCSWNRWTLTWATGAKEGI